MGGEEEEKKTFLILRIILNLIKENIKYIIKGFFFFFC
jgi:hypothetical protein